MVLALASAALAQNVLGTITGRALDSSGALIPGVEVTISSPQMIGGTRSSVTDETGSYRFTQLAVGTYRVTFALPGFKTLNIDGVTVASGASATINGTMEVSAVAEEVTVTSTAPTIDLEAATVAVNWSSQKLDNLPSGHTLRNVAMMVPGMTVTTPDIGGTTMGGATGTGGRVYGRAGGEEVNVDGNAWSTIFGDYQTVEQISISTAAKGAEARNAGAAVTLVIKSGSNDFHGSVMGNWQDGKWQSNNVTQKLLDKGFAPGNTKFTHYDDYNFEGGGRIVRDKLWFYAAFSHQFAGQYINGFIEEKTGKEAVYSTLLDSPTLKLTYQLNPQMKFESVAQGSRKWQPYRDGSALTPLEATQDQNAWTMNGPQLKWIYILSPRMTVDANVARGGYWWPMNPHTTDVRRTDITTGQTRGAYNKNYQRPIRWQEGANWSWFTDFGGTNNEIKTGFLSVWNKSFTETFGYPNQQVYRYRSTTAQANAGQYFLIPDSVQAFDYPNFTGNISYSTAWFINDKITVNRKLTMNLGIRYERNASALPVQGNPGTGPFSVKNLYPVMRDFPVYNAWGPRLSFVYDVKGNGSLALKAGYGRYPSGGPTGSSVSPASNTTYTYNNWNGTIPFVPAPGQTPTSTSGGVGERALDPGLKGSWLDEYTAGVEFGLNRDTVVRFNLVRKYDHGGSKTLNLATPYEAFTDFRLGVDPGRDNVAGTSDDGVVYTWAVPTSNPNRNITRTRTVQVVGNEAANQYMAYEGTLSKHYSNGWSFLVGYEADFAKQRGSNPQNPNALYYNWQLPEWHYNFKASGQYDLPFGFMYSSVYSAQSGQYFGRSVQVQNAVNSTVSVQVEGQAGRYPYIKLWDNRVSKTVKLGDRSSIEGFIDIFNTLNSSAVRSQVNTNGPNYLKPISAGGIDASAASSILTARILKIGGRWRF